MGYFLKAEQELVVNISAGDPHNVAVYSSWPYYTTRLLRCEGFTLTEDFQPGEGGRAVSGTVDISDFQFLYLRRQLSDKQQPDFQRLRDRIGEPHVATTRFRPDAGERETLLRACADDPAALLVQTDSAVWLRRLADHPFAVLTGELFYDDHTEEQESVQRTFLLPRGLLSIRRNRPRYSEEHLKRLSDRMQQMRAARS